MPHAQLARLVHCTCLERGSAHRFLTCRAGTVGEADTQHHSSLWGTKPQHGRPGLTHLATAAAVAAGTGMLGHSCSGEREGAGVCVGV